MNLSRGQRDKLSKHINTATEITIDMATNGSAEYDYCCFGVDAAGKLSDERYMIFYNQTASPNDEIRYSPAPNAAKFALNLSALPASIVKLVFTVSIDGPGTMGEIAKHTLTLSQNGQTALSLEVAGSDFSQEKAIISIELYKKDEWRLNATASGFNGGLSALLASYGGTEESSSAPAPAPAPVQAAPAPAPTPAPAQPQRPAIATSAPSVPGIPNLPPAITPVAATPVPGIPNLPPAITPIAAAPVPGIPNLPPAITPVAATPAPAAKPVSAPAATPALSIPAVALKKNEEQLTQSLMNKISLSKDKVNLEKHVVSLSKTVVSLSKKSGVDLGSTRARVVVVLDYSGSMRPLYENGTVQNTINRLVPLGLTFDDNGSIDVYLFQNDHRKLDDLLLSNYENYITNVVKRSGYNMGSTHYAPVLNAIILGETKRSGFFQRTVEEIPPLVDDHGDPTFILFITDGENMDKGASDAIISKSSKKNVFIQFIGIGDERFAYLKKLDDMPGRVRDNTGFSQLMDLNRASDDELYTNVLEQFSNWLRGLQ